MDDLSTEKVTVFCEDCRHHDRQGAVSYDRCHHSKVTIYRGDAPFVRRPYREYPYCYSKNREGSCGDFEAVVVAESGPDEAPIPRLADAPDSVCDALLHGGDK